MTELPHDDSSSLERARQRLYEPATPAAAPRPLSVPAEGKLPHAWNETPLSAVVAARTDSDAARKRQVRAASVFFTASLLFFLVAIGVAVAVYYFGSNAVSVDKLALTVEGPTSIAGGDSVPLSVTITNSNAVAIDNATIDIAFPPNTRDASDPSKPYLRYSENVGTLPSGSVTTRQIKAVLFGGEGAALAVPVSVSYAVTGSNAVFVKKATYTVAVSTVPLSLTVDGPTEAISGEPMTITLTARSNASTPFDTVVITGAFPFGYTVQSSSIPVNNSSILIGTLAPGATKKVTLTGILAGQQGDLRAFHFTIGTAKSPQDQTIAVAYMTQDSTVAVAAPFISTKLTVNGTGGPNLVLSPGSVQNVTVSYANTLGTNISNAVISVMIAGAAVDYTSIRSSNGFYRSSDYTVVFSRDTDPGLSVLTPGASGIGTITFSTLPGSASVVSPSITFTTAVSGTRVGQRNVPEVVSSSAVTSAKVSSAVSVVAASHHSSGALVTSGPIPPRAGQATTYTIEWTVRSQSSTIAGGTMSATLPSYVAYSGLTAGQGFTYDSASRTVTWNMGDLTPGATLSGSFQVALTPSTSQKGTSPTLTSGATFSGFDRFAQIQVSATAERVTTETPGDPGYVPTNATVVQ